MESYMYENYMYENDTYDVYGDKVSTNQYGSLFDDKPPVKLEPEAEKLIDDGPPVNDWADPLDVRWEIKGLEVEDPQPVQGCSIFAEDAYGSVCYSKHRYDHKSFTSWFNAVMPDIEKVYNLLKADWPMPEELNHIRADRIKALIGAWGEIDRGFEYVKTACRDVLERDDIIFENRDIVEAIHFARKQTVSEPLAFPLYLNHLKPIVLRSAMDESDRVVALDEPGSEDRRLINVINAYKRKLIVFERQQRERAIPRAFAYFFRDKPIPTDLAHIRTDIFELMVQPEMMRDLKLGHLHRNMNLLHKSVKDLVIDAYKVMLALEDQTYTMLELLRLHYWPYIIRGVIPSITLACDRDIFQKVCCLVATDHEPNKQSLINNQLYIMECVWYLNAIPPAFYLRQANFAIWVTHTKR